MSADGAFAETDEALLLEALTRGRNIHLTENYVVSTDIHGIKMSGKTPPIWRGFFQECYALRAKGSVTKSSHYTMEFNGYRYRCCLANSQKGWVISMRFLPVKIPSLRDDLQMDWNMLKPLTDGAGLTLFAGRMNSGKSTTMAACIGNLDPHASEIAMIEDPIEIIFPDPMIIQREINTHVDSFPEAIRDCVRQSRTTIVVSEIRDSETANAALLAASTGHSVLATIHADNAFDIYTRMLTLIDTRYERVLARNLRGLWWQHVVRFGTTQRKPLAVYESLLVDSEARNIFDAGPTKLQMLASVMEKQGRKSMGEYAMSLVGKGVATREEMSEFTARRNRIAMD
ncbi:ATPase, T2SS/T4P/T4SS family [Pseudomonas tritici]|uniref:ATPase, T2SS/T4P/T4SS family n=1 Tax=Pseudomonas tritici TaxID=2745518 RepID=UPI00387B0945